MHDLGVDADKADRLLNTASALVTKYGAADDCPDSILDEAVLRTAGWLAAQPMASARREDVGGVATSYAVNMHSALRHSGAQSLLDPWKRRGAVSI